MGEKSRIYLDKDPAKEMRTAEWLVRGTITRQTTFRISERLEGNFHTLLSLRTVQLRGGTTIGWGLLPLISTVPKFKDSPLSVKKKEISGPKFTLGVSKELLCSYVEFEQRAVAEVVQVQSPNK